MEGIDSYDVLVVNANTDFADSSGKGQILVISWASIDNAIKKFGAGSGLFELGAFKSVYYADNDNMTFADSDFTVATWVRFNSVATKQTLIAHAQSFINFWDLYFDGATNKIGFKAVSANVTIIDVSADWAPNTDTWYYICACRNGSVFSISIDCLALSLSGTQPTGSIGNFTAFLVLGDCLPFATYLDGWLDDVRVSVGIARCISGCTIPTNELTAPIDETNKLQVINVIQTKTDIQAYNEIGKLQVINVVTDENDTLIPNPLTGIGSINPLQIALLQGRL